MTSLLGLHWLREHPDNRRDLAHIEAMQYPSIKLFKPAWDNRDFCRDLLTVLPRDAYILARDHDLSEQKEDMWRDPDWAGANHADQWIDKVQGGQVYLPTDRTFFLGINEPDATSGDRDKIDRYTAAFLRRLQAAGLRGGAFNFSTGHPRTVDGTPATQADYSVFERSHRAIVEGHHLGVLHIYGTGAVPCAPGHFDRLWACDWQDVEWVVGEFGADEHVIGGGNHDGFHAFFNGRLNDYCAWLDTAILGINDPRIHSYQVFTCDFSHPWDSFDIRPIRDALEGYDWQHVKAATRPFETHLPNIVSEGPTPSAPVGYIVAPAGLNLRSAPDGDILTAMPYGAQVHITGVDSNNWLRVRYGDLEGFAVSMYISLQEPEPLPQPEPVGDTWQRSRAFVARWEGGYQNVHNDAGNWTGCAVGVGELKGTKYGISACSYPHLDIRNLTMAEADAIYHRDYWQRSGADNLPWPACLLIFDTAVLHGVGTAQAWLAEAGPNPYVFAAKRLRSYTKKANFDFWGKAWTLRVADLLEAMSQ